MGGRFHRLSIYLSCVVCFHHWGEINERGNSFGLCYLPLETLAKLAPLSLGQCLLRELSLLKSPFGIKELAPFKAPFPFLVFVVALYKITSTHAHSNHLFRQKPQKRRQKPRKLVRRSRAWTVLLANEFPVPHCDGRRLDACLHSTR